MMKNVWALLLVAAFCLYAADFWDSKPYTEWNEKEVLKFLEGSPWADRVNVRTGQKGVIATSEDGKGNIMGEIEVPVSLWWQSAVPIKQALARRQELIGSPTAANAKAIIERQEPYYVLYVGGLPGSLRAAAQDTEKLTAETSLKVKGKPDLKPKEIQTPGAAAPAAKGGPAGGGAPGGGKGFGGGKGLGGGNIDLYFLFPRDAALTAADKEAEFITKLGNITVRKKFKLSDMMFNGKFEM
jgi:hypothetical protein